MGLEDVADRTISKCMPRLLASCAASSMLPCEEYGPGMPTPMTFSRPSASTAMQR